jgi:hypothetical protein
MTPPQRLAEAIGESPLFTALLVARIAARLGTDKDTLAIRLLEVVNQIRGK